MHPVFVRAWTAHRDGRLDDAERDYRATLDAEPAHVDALHLLGVLRHQQGQHAEAADLVRRAVDLRPNDAALQLNLGNALKALGELDGAIERFRNALSLAPTFPMAHYNLGNAYVAAGRHEDAVDAFRRAVELQPNDASALNNLGNALHATDQPEAAAEAFERALVLRPGHAGAHNNLGMALNALGRAQDAIGQFRAALAAEPRFVAAQFNLANTLAAVGQNDEAIPLFENVIALQPQFSPALFALGNALAAQARHADAARLFERAIGLDPKFALAWLSLGIARHALRNYEAALRAFEQALRLRPDLGPAHLNRAMVWLTLGNFARGLPEYEWRLESLQRRAVHALPRWHGEPLDGRTLVIHAEQGLGDTLNFVRFIPLLVERTTREAQAAQAPLPRIVLEVQPTLLPLVEPMAEQWRVSLVAVGDVPVTGASAPDVQCPLLSLPLVLGTTVDTIPARTPYLVAPATYRRKWRGSLGGQSKRKVGIAWSGRQQRSENRSIALDQLAALDPLFALAGIDWIVLQPDLSDAERAALDAHPHASRIHRVDGRVDNFADTAAIVERLDAVVSIDTSIAHLAGALRRPLWIMLPFSADWRWFTDTRDSAWYPAAHLVRQRQPGVWKDVVEDVARELARF